MDAHTTIILLVPHEGRTVEIKFRVATEMLAMPDVLGPYIASRVEEQLGYFSVTANDSGFVK